MTHPNEELARSEMEAALRRDVEGMLAHYTEDFILHYPGRNALSETYRGKHSLRESVHSSYS
ncbi:MAG TPA: nuclear transport factor 2 family protein [Anaerolineales bacterium]|nr:nuclear transport factor 2 family protein [Anaerolineales bacterium]